MQVALLDNKNKPKKTIAVVSFESVSRALFCLPTPTLNIPCVQDNAFVERNVLNDP